METRASLDIERLVENVRHVLWIESLNGQAHHTDSFLCDIRSEDFHATDPAETFDQLPNESQLVMVIRRHAAIEKPGRSCLKSDESRRVVVTRFVFVGERFRLRILFASRSRSPLPKTRQMLFDSRAHIHNPGAEGT
jgi:hypothetical protein